jgi:Tfp pilus assembly protein PilF
MCLLCAWTILRHETETCRAAAAQNMRRRVPSQVPYIVRKGKAMTVNGLHTSRNLLALTLSIAVVLGGCSASPEEKKAKHLQRAQAYFEKGQYQEAVLEYRNVVQVDPKNADAHYKLALAYLKVGGMPGLQGAFEGLSKTVELDPSNRDAQLKLGELYLLAREPAKAKERAD